MSAPQRRLVILFFFFLPSLLFAGEKEFFTDIKITVGAKLAIGHWDHVADGLLEWPSSPFYQSYICPKISFSNNVIYGPDVQLAYHHVSIHYFYITNVFTGRKSTFTTNNMIKIAQVSGWQSNMDIFIQYLFMGDRVGCYLGWHKSHSEIANIGDYNLVDYHLGGDRVWSKELQRGWFGGVTGRTKLKFTNLFLQSRVTVFPLMKTFYFYSNNEVFDSETKLKGTAYTLELDLGYNFKALTPSIGYRYFSSLAKDKTVKDYMKYLVFSLYYTF